MIILHITVLFERKPCLLKQLWSREKDTSKSRTEIKKNGRLENATFKPSGSWG
jgi:hypothetical protein